MLWPTWQHPRLADAFGRRQLHEAAVRGLGKVGGDHHGIGDKGRDVVAVHLLDIVEAAPVLARVETIGGRHPVAHLQIARHAEDP